MDKNHNLGQVRGDATRVRQLIQAGVEKVFSRGGGHALGLHTLQHPEDGTILHDTTFVDGSGQRFRVSVAVAAVDTAGNPL